MTDEQFKQVMATLRAMAKQGQAIRDEIAELSDDVADVKALCGDLEALHYQALQRLDEL